MKTFHQAYDDYATAVGVVSELEDAGFTDEEVTLIGKHNEFSGAQVGATTGAALGGGAGLLAGLGVMAVPGLGPLVAAGWLLPMLAGGAAGAVTGSVLGAFMDSGVEEMDAHVYAETLRRGGAVIIVRTADEQAPAARDILTRNAKIDTAARRRGYQTEGWKRFEDRVG